MKTSIRVVFVRLVGFASFSLLTIPPLVFAANAEAEILALAKTETNEYIKCVFEHHQKSPIRSKDKLATTMRETCAAYRDNLRDLLPGATLLKDVDEKIAQKILGEGRK